MNMPERHEIRKTRDAAAIQWRCVMHVCNVLYPYGGVCLPAVQSEFTAHRGANVAELNSDSKPCTPQPETMPQP